MNYDMEDLLADIETLMKANLNTKIGAINTEKVRLNCPFDDRK